MRADCALYYGKASRKRQQNESHDNLVQWGREIPYRHIGRWTFPDVGHHANMVFIKLWLNKWKWGAERSVEQWRAKTTMHKGTRPYCPFWQEIFWCLLPNRTHQSHLFQLLSQFCSRCKRLAPGFERNQAETKTSWLFCSMLECNCCVHVHTDGA